MLDVFLIFNLALIVLLAILIFKNRSWKTKPIIVVLFAVILIVFTLELVFG